MAASQAQDCWSQQGKTQCCAKPPYCCAVGLLECCQPFAENSGCYAHSTTCSEYQWSEGGPFDFLDMLLIGAALLLLVSMVDSCQLVRPVGWGTWVEYPYIKNACSNWPTQKPLAPMSGFLSMNACSHGQHFCERLQRWIHRHVATYLFQ